MEKTKQASPKTSLSPYAKKPQAKTIKEKRSKLDNAWKEALRQYFQSFVALCWPSIYPRIDWEKGYTFLDKELESIYTEEAVGKRIPDKLVQLYLKDQSEVWVLIHIEVEAQERKEAPFPERIFIYRYRIYDLYRKDIATLAILLDKDPHWRPETYHSSFLGTEHTLTYPVLKILDFEDRIEELRHSKNPFALVILAQLAAQQTQKNKEARLIRKYELTKWLYLHGWDKNDILEMLRFLEEILVLSPKLGLEYIQKVKTLEQELKVSFITTSEQRWLNQGIHTGIQQGIERGIEKGIHTGESNIIVKQLTKKFKAIPDVYRHKIETASPALLEAWSEYLLDATNIDEVFREH